MLERKARGADVELADLGPLALELAADDLGDQVESIDINPVVALPDGQGAVALDALVVLRS